MKIALIWAMDENRLIGARNRLPWKLPVDMKWFREQTMGKPMVMGRKTFESFGARPLPGRTNIIVTRDPHYRVEGAVVVHGIDEALQAAGDADEVMIIGGASFYEQLLPRADRLYITEVHGVFDGDAWFPDFDLSVFREVRRKETGIDEKNPWACSFIVYEHV
jgi:dihydrofolate reductase